MIAAPFLFDDDYLLLLPTQRGVIRCRKYGSSATASRQTRSILQAAERSHCSGAERPRSSGFFLQTAPPCGYRRLVCHRESATLAIATAAHAIQHLEWSCGRDQRQPTSHGLWLTSSCLPSMHHANRFMPGRSSKPNATGESRARWHGLRAAAGVSSFEPAVLSQYYCLDSILGLRLSLHQRPTNS
jgi:hypothetical protein